jgi:hypothetical protein
MVNNAHNVHKLLTSRSEKGTHSTIGHHKSFSGSYGPYFPTMAPSAKDLFVHILRTV